MGSRYSLPLVELVSGAARRALVDVALTRLRAGDTDEWHPQSTFVDATDYSAEAMRQNMPVLVSFGVYEIRDEDAKIPHYRPAETPVTEILRVWDGPPVTEVLGSTGRQRLTGWFLEQSDPEDSYSKSALQRESGMSYDGVTANVDDLVEYGILDTVEGTRSTEYTLAGSPIVAMLYDLNEAIYEQVSGDVEPTAP